MHVNKTHKRLVKSILAENEAFAKMSKKKKRVKIAKDVIKSLKVQYITPLHEAYIQASVDKDTLTKYTKDGTIKRSKADKLFGSLDCNACALGSLFITSVLNYNGDHFNKISVNFDDTYAEEYVQLGHAEDIYDELTETFSSKQIHAIELVFEDWENSEVENTFSKCLASPEKSIKWRKKCLKNYSKLKNDNIWTMDESDYLVYSIMRNIIENDGKFDTSYTKFSKVISHKDMRS